MFAFHNKVPCPNDFGSVIPGSQYSSFTGFACHLPPVNLRLVSERLPPRTYEVADTTYHQVSVYRYVRSTLSKLDINYKPAKSLTQHLTMGALELQCSLAKSSESREDKDVIRVHRECGDELRICFNAPSEFLMAKATLSVHPVWGNILCTRQLIIRKLSQKPWLPRAGSSFQCIISCTVHNKFDRMAELVQSEKLCGSVSSLELPLPSTSTWWA